MVDVECESDAVTASDSYHAQQCHWRRDASEKLTKHWSN